MKIYNVISATVFGLIAFALCLITFAALWIFSRFGGVTLLQIQLHLFESPDCLPPMQLCMLIGGVVLSAVLGICIAVSIYVSNLRLANRFGRLHPLLSLPVISCLFCYLGFLLYAELDRLFGISFELECRRTTSHLFQQNYVPLNPSLVKFPQQKHNLIVIVSESLEEGFAQGMIDGQNLLPRLSNWRNNHFHATTQRQVSGVDGTTCALAALTYGVPKLARNMHSLLESGYPRFQIPSLWDVLLTNGYSCAYVQGGNFEFGSKGKLFPVHPRMTLVGFDELRTNAAYLAEPDKISFGVNDEIMFEKFKESIAALENSEMPFAAMALTLNTHGPDGWSSARRRPPTTDKLKNAIIEQDEMIADFIKWFESRPVSTNTAVVVVGDHQLWGKSWMSVKDRSTFNAFSIPWLKQSPFTRNRIFTTFDVAPTFLSILGCTLPDGGKWGLGRSLCEPEPTLLEQVGRETYERNIRASIFEYEAAVFTKTK